MHCVGLLAPAAVLGVYSGFLKDYSQFNSGKDPKGIERRVDKPKAHVCKFQERSDGKAGFLSSPQASDNVSGTTEDFLTGFLALFI